MIKRLIHALAVSGVLVVAGCTSIQKTEQTVDTAATAVDAMRVLNERNVTTGAVIRSKRQRLAGREIIVDTNVLPAWFSQRHEYSTKGSQSISSALEDIGAASSILIKQSEITTTANMSQQLFSPGADRSNDPLSGTVSLEYVGTTKGLFDTLAAKANISWRYNAEASCVEFYRFETRTITLSIPGGAKTVTSGISLNGVSGGSSAGGSGGGGGSASTAGNVSVSQTKTIDPWKSVMDGIGSILQDGRAPAASQSPNQSPQGQSPTGAVMTASGSAGTAIANTDMGFLTITARPATLDRIERYVSTINARFAKNVHVDVKIYSVSLDEQSSLGFSLDMLYTQVDKLGGRILGPTPLTSGSAVPGILTLTSNKASGPWNGSTLVGQALSKFGKVALQKQGQVIAVNGQPSPLQVANEISYIASSSVSQSPNVGTVTTQTPGIKVVGFTANFTPLILGDNRILLSYEMQLSALAGSLTPNAAGTQTPTVASQTLQQNAFVKDGQAIVLFGFDDKSDSIDSTINPGGASKAAHAQRQMLVIVMQINTGERE
ncbi:hypothetical protein LPN04_31390 [Rugamonas sp. A1-17]|nr:hypothetical protein [Rugamonas sp. A1-17]